MINKVALSSIETLVKSGAKMPEYVRASSILPKLPETNAAKAAVAKAEYSSPFAPIIDTMQTNEMPKITYLDIIICKDETL